MSIFVDGQCIKNAKADLPRPDVKEAGISRTGLCGFNVLFTEMALGKLPSSFLLSVRDSTGTELPGSPVEMRGNPAIPPGQPIRSPFGDQYTLNKNGGLSVRFSDMAEETKEGFLQHARNVLGAFDQLGYKGSLSYGSLLGAVRHGGVIPYDDDIDLMFISKMHTLEEAAEEFQAVLQQLSRQGYVPLHHNRGQAHIHGSVGGKRFASDTFLSWFDESGRFYLNFTSKGLLHQDQVLPLRPIKFEGSDWPAPAEPEALCWAQYGDNWRVPDPTFRWTPPPEVRAFFRPLYGAPAAAERTARASDVHVHP